MAARMSEKEWAMFTASKYISPWTGKKLEEPPEEVDARIIDDYDVIRMTRKLHDLANHIEQARMFSLVNMMGIGLLILLHWIG